MGQKVNPIGFRLGINRNWDSRWFAGKEYSRFVLEDFQIRKFLKKRLMQAGVSKIEIERAASKVRVRIHGDLARIEVPQSDIDRVLKSRERIVKGLKDAGFRYVTLDLKGYRTGSLNEALSL